MTDHVGRLRLDPPRREYSRPSSFAHVVVNKIMEVLILKRKTEMYFHRYLQLTIADFFLAMKTHEACQIDPIESLKALYQCGSNSS